MQKVKRRLLKAELAVLVCVASVWAFRQVVNDIDCVEAAVLNQVVVDSDKAEAYRFLAQHYNNCGDFEKSIQAGWQLFRMSPDDPEAWHSLGVTYERGRNFELAIHAYKQAAKLDPSSYTYHRQLFYIYYDMHRYNEAIEEARRIIKLEPDFPSMNVILAELYIVTGQYDTAISECKRVLQLDANYDKAQVHYYLGEAYLHVGSKDLAKEEYNALKTLNENLAAQLLSLIEQKPPQKELNQIN